VVHKDAIKAAETLMAGGVKTRSLGTLLGGDAPMVTLELSGPERAALLEEATRLRDELAGDGLDATVGDVQVRISDSVTLGGVATVVALVVGVRAGLGYAAKDLKTLKRFLQSEDKNLGLTQIGPTTVEALVAEWLDEQYGNGEWQYDPDKTQIAQLTGVGYVVDVVETKSGTSHRLLVDKLSITEMPKGQQ
jgi:hypothetical protein